jgi:N-methylhydantoinase B
MPEMNAVAAQDVFRYRAGKSARKAGHTADPTTTEIVRHSLCSAARQMKWTLLRTAFSPIIYDALDFAVALYDDRMRLLGQAPTLPAFMGTMSFCVEAAVEAASGAQTLEPGDVIAYNVPYGTGSHAQDMAIVMPVFYADRIVGYAANKAHQLDIGAKNPYCTDTTDVFQEGVVLPGVKLFRAGKRVEDVYRTALANSRAPKAMEGDLHAQVASARVGAAELVRLVGRFGAETFAHCVEQMYDQGEAAVRKFFERIPDGRYTARSYMDDNGIDKNPIEFEIAIEIDGSSVCVDFSNVPDAQAGPVNCPFPSTVSATRVSVMMLAGGGGEPNEGFFRAVDIITRPGSMFHPQSPSPCYLYGWPLMSAMEAIYRALAAAHPDIAPAGGAGDICGLLGFGRRGADGELFYAGGALPVGHGAHARGDGATLFVPGLSNSRMQSLELQETKAPIRFHRLEFLPDSGGPGMHRGGLGYDYHWEALGDMSLVSTIERTRDPAWGIYGGGPATPNGFTILYPDGRRVAMGKCTDLRLPRGTIVELRCGGGGGYGAPDKRSKQAVMDDLRAGVISERHARQHHPQAFR